MPATILAVPEGYRSRVERYSPAVRSSSLCTSSFPLLRKVCTACNECTAPARTRRSNGCLPLSMRVGTEVHGYIRYSTEINDLFVPLVPLYQVQAVHRASTT